MTSARLNRLSAENATKVARSTFASNFYATKRAGIYEIRYVVPGHDLCVALAGAGSTWREAFTVAGLSVGIATYRSAVAA